MLQRTHRGYLAHQGELNDWMRYHLLRNPGAPDPLVNSDSEQNVRTFMASLEEALKLLEGVFKPDSIKARASAVLEFGGSTLEALEASAVQALNEMLEADGTQSLDAELKGVMEADTGAALRRAFRAKLLSALIARANIEIGVMEQSHGKQAAGQALERAQKANDIRLLEAALERALGQDITTILEAGIKEALEGGLKAALDTAKQTLHQEFVNRHIRMFLEQEREARGLPMPKPHRTSLELLGSGFHLLSPLFSFLRWDVVTRFFSGSPYDRDPGVLAGKVAWGVALVLGAGWNLFIWTILVPILLSLNPIYAIVGAVTPLIFTPLVMHVAVVAVKTFVSMRESRRGGRYSIGSWADARRYFAGWQRLGRADWRQPGIFEGLDEAEHTYRAWQYLMLLRDLFGTHRLSEQELGQFLNLTHERIKQIARGEERATLGELTDEERRALREAVPAQLPRKVVIGRVPEDMEAEELIRLWVNDFVRKDKPAMPERLEDIEPVTGFVVATDEPWRVQMREMLAPRHPEGRWYVSTILMNLKRQYPEAWRHLMADLHRRFGAEIGAIQWLEAFDDSTTIAQLESKIARMEKRRKVAAERKASLEQELEAVRRGLASGDEATLGKEIENAGEEVKKQGDDIQADLRSLLDDFMSQQPNEGLIQAVEDFANDRVVNVRKTADEFRRLYDVYREYHDRLSAQQENESLPPYLARREAWVASHVRVVVKYELPFQLIGEIGRAHV